MPNLNRQYDLIKSLFGNDTEEGADIYIQSRLVNCKKHRKEKGNLPAYNRSLDKLVINYDRMLIRQF